MFGLMSENVIIGYSGHAFVVADAIIQSGNSLDYYTEKKKVSNNPYELEYLGYEAEDDFKGWDKGYNFILGVGDNNIRARLGRMLMKRGENLLTVIHPSAKISKKVSVGEGTFVAASSTINPLSEIGKYAILNTSSVIEHECYIDEGAHIAPGAVLSGNVKVGKHSFIGANAVIKENVSIGDNVVVGAGATIIQDIPNGKKVVGNPGREI